MLSMDVVGCFPPFLLPLLPTGLSGRGAEEGWFHAGQLGTVDLGGPPMLVWGLPQDPPVQLTANPKPGSPRLRLQASPGHAVSLAKANCWISFFFFLIN